MSNNISKDELKSVLDEIWKDIEAKIYRAESKRRECGVSEQHYISMEGYIGGLSDALHLIIGELEKRFLKDK